MNANFKSVIVGVVISLVAVTAWADAWETGPNGGDNTFENVNILLPFAAPQLHDLASVGGTPDEDWFRITVFPNRSYEVSILNSNIDWTGRTFERLDSGRTFVQAGTNLDVLSLRLTMRWIHAVSFGEAQHIRIVGKASDTATAFYEIVFRETTLFCPRFNNAGSQVSVLIVQRGGYDGMGNCDGTAFFYDEDQTVVGTQALVIGANDVNVYSLPGVPGLAGQKGGARIAHTCGVGGLKAKLVSLEPATGFSFDTICTPREQ